MLNRLLAFLYRLESGLLVLMLFSILGLALVQIGARLFFDSGVVWADPLIRVMVMWLGLLGAIAASADNRHISIDLLSRYLSPLLSSMSQAMGSGFAAIVCGFVSFYAANMVTMDREFMRGDLAGIPLWCLGLIIPIGFFVMGLRFLILFYRRCHSIIKGNYASVD